MSENHFQTQAAMSPYAKKPRGRGTTAYTIRFESDP